MALSTCTPLENSIHQKRFQKDSLFNDHWLPVFSDLERRELVKINYESKEISLTKPGKTLIEAIINTDINSELFQ